MVTAGAWLLLLSLLPAAASETEDEREELGPFLPRTVDLRPAPLAFRRTAESGPAAQAQRAPRPKGNITKIPDPTQPRFAPKTATQPHPLEAVDQFYLQEFSANRLSPTALNQVLKNYRDEIADHLKSNHVLFKTYDNFIVPNHLERGDRQRVLEFFIEISPEGSAPLNALAARLAQKKFSLVFRARLNLEHLVPYYKIRSVSYLHRAIYLGSRFLMREAFNLRSPETRALEEIIHLYNQAQARYMFIPSLKVKRLDDHRQDFLMIDRSAKIALPPPGQRYNHLHYFFTDALTLYYALDQHLHDPSLRPDEQAQLLMKARSIFYNSSFLLANTVYELNLIVYNILQHQTPYQIRDFNGMMEMNFYPAHQVQLSLRLPHPCPAIDPQHSESVLAEEKFQKIYMYLTTLLEKYQKIHHQMNHLHHLAPEQLAALTKDVKDLAFLPLTVETPAHFIAYWEDHYRLIQDLASTRIKNHNKYIAERCAANLHAPQHRAHPPRKF